MSDQSDQVFEYKAAMEEIEAIVHTIEHEQPDIDQITTLVKRASTLLQQCKQKLRNTEEELGQALSQLDDT